MKKKLLVSLFLLIAVVSLSGCTKKKESAEEKTIGQVVKIDGEEIKLDTDTNAMEFHYKQNTTNFTNYSYDDYRVVFVKANDRVLAYMTISWINDYTLEDGLKEISTEDLTTTDKKINGIIYKYYEKENVEAEGMTNASGHSYLYELNGKLYQIAFVSDKDIKDFEKAIMEDAYFKEK